MSHSRRRLKEDTLSAFPIPTAEERITRVVGLRGACVCEVEQTNGERLLCQIPTKFRKTVWIKKGNYIIIREAPGMKYSERKIRAMVNHVLFRDQIKHLKERNLWPKEFVTEEEREELPKEDSEGDEDSDLFRNPNHQWIEESDRDRKSVV